MYESVRALECLHTATDLPHPARVPSALHRSTYASIYGASSVHRPGRHAVTEEAIRAVLLEALGRGRESLPRCRDCGCLEA